MNQKNQYMSYMVGHVSGGNLHKTRLRIYSDSINIPDGIVVRNDRLNSIAWRLHHDFSKEVFDVPVKQIIENIRTITDIKRMSTEWIRKK